MNEYIFQCIQETGWGKLGALVLIRAESLDDALEHVPGGYRFLGKVSIAINLPIR